ncbi:MULTISPECIES: YihY/virulence factor BrkB family protein [unclassified Mycolicibacterium]|uniref:YihY/virulence factor BrkB family protein n=1 Tax=unclassified Mycolicibacterium TaxID=2636767 RepID=UPI0012DCBBED|nr:MULTISPECIES: YihY/virulence factor BrkB family protein [unclassified Mycolicibacterium]MUL80277.1 YihY/virulence factor BrkB family protein [Mycolicibacterium sp. CBMA 329]MUL86044.1 YihY/virulence factor BrkB family protein [Mycolicibacterium sp. CBMA 331]MUM00818.1 YihY/virulence factor BrkB family protein [Mycolicibacterium sp. CBMA 334]MUM36340.1 YihY/virulence factor BrkB family protein [Mycolicibacterium sp. CBMA 247]MUM42108.1 YihY/virulence factor BrkB family protein [Mycolicibacte
MTGQPLPVPPSRHHIWHITRRTLSKSWDDSIFSESAQAAFWCALSLPPLLLGMLGSLAYIAPLFGPDTLPTIQDQLINAANSFFSPNVVNEIIEPTIRDIVRGARGEVVSVGFVISLWAGSSAVSAFVDSIVEAHDQTPLRHPVRQRFYALGLYVIMLVFAIAAAPIMALGPRAIAEHIPDSWANVLHYGYYPALFLAVLVGVTALYRVSLPAPIPTHRLVLGAVLATVVFLVATFGLRIYLTWITSTGYTYGALATPIAFLLFAFFLGFAIMLGAELNAAIQEEWPAADTHARRLREWLEDKALNGGAQAPIETTVPEPVEPPRQPPTS